MSEIKVGDLVRSYDFPSNGDPLFGRDDCYVEGRVTAEDVEPYFVGHLEVFATKRVYRGVEEEIEPMLFYPPKNGRPVVGGGKTDGVVLLESFDLEPELKVESEALRAKLREEANPSFF